MTPNRFLIALVLCVLAVPSFALAHEEAPSGPVKVQLHVNPDDKPVAGQVSALAFNFLVDSAAFNVSACDCSVEIKFAEKVIERRVIDASSLNVGSIEADGADAMFQYSFPKAGTYEVALSAKPRSGATFAAFTDEFPVTVAPAVVKPLPPLAWYGLIAAGLSFGTIVAFWRELKSILKR